VHLRPDFGSQPKALLIIGLLHKRSAIVSRGGVC
jgi:hypothetical protein